MNVEEAAERACVGRLKKCVEWPLVGRGLCCLSVGVEVVEGMRRWFRDDDRNCT